MYQTVLLCVLVLTFPNYVYTLITLHCRSSYNLSSLALKVIKLGYVYIHSYNFASQP